MGELLYFAETTLLYIAAIFFVAGILLRGLFFVINILHSRPAGRHSVLQRFVTLFGIAVPFHRAVLKRPVYAAIRYAFHVCIIIVPIWFSGHIYLWEESRFEKRASQRQGFRFFAHHLHRAAFFYRVFSHPR